jgi:hypothetical protein
LHRPDLCPRILVGPDLSVLFHGPDLWSGILHNRCWGILSGLYLCPLGLPSLDARSSTPAMPTPKQVTVIQPNGAG